MRCSSDFILSIVDGEKSPGSESRSIIDVKFGRTSSRVPYSTLRLEARSDKCVSFGDQAVRHFFSDGKTGPSWMVWVLKTTRLGMKKPIVRLSPMQAAGKSLRIVRYVRI